MQHKLLMIYFFKTILLYMQLIMQVAFGSYGTINKQHSIKSRSQAVEYMQWR